VRSAALHPIILDALKAQRHALAERGLPVIGPGLIFPSATGGYHVPSYLEKPFRRMLRVAGITKHLSAHGMRRTANNLMRQADVDRIVLHATIGHSSDAMTELYSHVGREEKHAAMQKLFLVVHPEQRTPERSPNRSPDSGNSVCSPSVDGG
jgi:integrase